MAFNFWDFVFLAGLGLDKGLQSWACQYMKMLFGFSFPSLICSDTASDKPQMEQELKIHPSFLIGHSLKCYYWQTFATALNDILSPSVLVLTRNCCVYFSSQYFYVTAHNYSFKPFYGCLTFQEYNRKVIIEKDVVKLRL